MFLVDSEKLDQSLLAIIEKKEELNALSTNDPGYTIEENNLKRLEEDFLSTFGSYLEEVIFNVHDEFCPDNDVMKPIAYIASHYIARHDKKWEAPSHEGIPVQCDDYPELKARLVLIPSPTRLVLQAENNTFREVVWKAV